jgi:hypothetical protein
MQVKSYLTHKNIFLFGLVVLAVGIPISRFLVSVSQLILLGNWLLETRFVQKWNTLRSSKLFWAYIAIFLFYVLGMLWTTDYEYGLKDLRIKLPMLWLPVLFFTTPKLSKKEYHAVLHFFVAAVVAASLWSMAVYLGLTKIEVHDVREISRFESHIRFSLMIVLAVLYLFFVIIRKDVRHRIVFGLLLCWLLGFLILLQSFTGIIIAGLVAFSALSWVLFSRKSTLLKLAFTGVVLSGSVFMGYLVLDEWKKLNRAEEVDFASLPAATASHRWYYHEKNSRLRENGNLVWIYIQDDEMRQEWNKKSWRGYDSLDFKGNPLRFTLVRYLASKGLTRDSAGVNRLSEEDIRHIENGYANYLYTSSSGLRPRIHELLWELEQMEMQQNPTGHSLGMRLEFWQTAWHIMKKNPAFGVGTGDVEQAFKKQYAEDKTSLPARWQLRSHNQFLAVGVALGLCGLLLFLLSYFSPFLFRRSHSRFFVFFMFIQLFSFFNEDTLETQAGVTFCVFFTQLLFHHDEYN